MKRYQGGTDGVMVTEKTIGQLERIISFAGVCRNGEHTEIVLETRIYTRMTKRAIGGTEWRPPEGGMNVVVPRTIRKAREIVGRINEVDPVMIELRKDMIETAIHVSARKRVAKHHAGFDPVTEYWED